ncbi:DUF4062 domain-containing protein [Acuticoccus sp. MNP-M23]|uniref:DUF4062 domain-containing protein n=1 Tax=Acuticoccus sp. MNP-M23 TaxID=3072793 RepID=UPI00281637DA|nr:DUF4062 domain-containing protein [Acuticoccus sp. MNP-M23]WMS42274.1 DUF4062 domain-containing protein [Acuticoccus sp. MNP-M23]
MNDPKYQIFVSSTYKDLKDERDAIIRAVLDLNHIPAGMELFPATNDSQIDYIYRVIDECDYYILVIGGRYGSVDGNGISYTEKELNYAEHKKIPILTFIHEDINKIQHGNVEQDKSQLEKLIEFRDRASSGRVVKYFSAISDLTGKVFSALSQEMRSNPQVGWIRGNNAASEDLIKEAIRSKELVKSLSSRISTLRIKIDEYEAIDRAKINILYYDDSYLQTLRLDGKQVIEHFAASLFEGTNDEEIKSGIHDLIHSNTGSEFDAHPKNVNQIKLFFNVFELIESKTSPDGAIIYTIQDKKRYLLKAAFLSMSEVNEPYDYDIPF